jgi:DNA-binding transcriptional regulator/RsmH inhibitor MraZ
VENQASHTLLDPIMHTDRNHQVILLQAMETAKADMQRRFILAIQLRIAVNILRRSMVYDMQYVENKI